MLVRDKQSYNTYTGYKIMRESILLLELEQSLKVSPEDVLIEIPELECYLIFDNNKFNIRFEIIKDER